MHELTDDYLETVDALHRLTVYVVSPAQRLVNGEIILRSLPGGFGTYEFGDGTVVRIEGRELVIDGESPRRAPITTLRAAAELAGIEPDVGQADQFDVPAPGDLDAQLHVGEQASADLARWYAFVTEVLETLRADATESDGVSPVRIWPEHFDAAIDLGAEADGRRATYGGSPADAGHPYPYLYASPWQGRIDPFFGDPSFKGASLSHAELVAADEPHSAALAFLRRARRIVTGR
jgi:hypothetical protein